MSDREEDETVRQRADHMTSPTMAAGQVLKSRGRVWLFGFSLFLLMLMSNVSVFLPLS